MPCRSFGPRLGSAWLSLSLLFAVAACSDAADEPRSSEPPAPFPGAAPGGAGSSSTAPPAAAPGSNPNPSNPATPSAPGVGSEMTGPLPLQPNPPLAAPGTTPPPASNQDPGDETPLPTLSRVLVFSRTVAFRHDSIGAGITAIQQLGVQNRFTVDASEDSSVFNDGNLAGYDVVVFLSTTADVLDNPQQGAFERYIQAGGGWVGIHAASDTEYDWPWYGQLLGGNAWFRVHPAIQTAQIDVEQASHASTAHMPARFGFQDELYNFRANPRPSVTVLLRLDESSYMAGEGAMGSDHPIAWYHEFDGGRAWYTGLGHRAGLYNDPIYTRHLLGGLRWAAGVVP
jgi:cytochrome c